MKRILKKISFAVLILFLFLLLGYFSLYFVSPPTPKTFAYGVTFSRPYAAQTLDLDWQELYMAILDDLKADHLRLPIYWNEIEPEPGKFFFDDYDFMFKEAQKRGVKIIPVVGQKLPRWPECHLPAWIQGADKETRQERIILMLKEVVKRYKDYPNLKIWQVENEPFLTWFGVCPKFDKKFLEQEVKLVRALSNAPVMVTDSGELSFWWRASRLGDYFGTTMYRKVFEENLKFYWTYPIPPAFYWLRANLNGKFPDQILITELQAEPWVKKPPIPTVPLEEQYQTMNLKTFKENVNYARKTRIPEIYLWGAEWWYWLKIQKGNPSIWNEAKKLWNPSH
jgi:hypothetical protein